MLNDFTGADQVYIACGYTDLRKGIDGLARLVQQQFELDPFTNTLFLFCGRRRDRIKGLYWEKDGFILLYKRVEQAKPVLDALLSWADEMQARTAPKSALGKAIHYLLEQWPHLTRYLEDDRLELSNNRAERSIKPFVMGRTNWLFANTTGGARASSLIYSLVETASGKGLDPYRYLLRFLQNAPQLSETDEAWLKSCFPQMSRKNAICRKIVDRHLGEQQLASGWRPFIRGWVLRLPRESGRWPDFLELFGRLFL